MKNLIAALTIFAKYKDLQNPTNCSHDVLCVVGIDEDEISKEDKAVLYGFGFFWSEEYESWASYRYGSA